MTQSISHIWTHIIFSTKKRIPFLNDPDLRQRMHHYIAGIAREQSCFVEIVGGTEDHIHLLIRINKNIPFSKLVQEIKGSSSLWIKTLDHPRSGDFYWQKGYAAFSVSQSQVNNVRDYIKNQEEHHKKKSFKDELIQFLVQHEISYKEQYLCE